MRRSNPVFVLISKHWLLTKKDWIALLTSTLAKAAVDFCSQ